MQRLSLHYGFKERFCNARAGWEKGSVERSVEVVRRAAFVSRTSFRSLEEAQACLDAALARLNSVSGIPGLSDSDQLELRADNRRKTLIKRADFPQLKYLGELVTEELPEDTRTVLPVLRSLDFVRNGQNLVLYGNPGTGKTHIAIALGIEACSIGMSVHFTSVPRLITQIREARQERSLHALENRFIKYDLVICDEFGYVSCDKKDGELLFNHLSLRYEKKSLIITTNLAFNRWNEIIADKVLVAAMVDRLTHKALLVNMTGESYRLKETKKLMKENRIIR